MFGQPRTLLAHEGVTEEVREIAAEQGQHEADGHLGAAQGDAPERHKERHHRPDGGPGDEAQDDAGGGDRYREASHGREEDGPVD